MIYILHIDTAAENAITAISADGQIVSQRVNQDARSQAANINLHINEVLKEAEIALKDLSAVSVIGGPGSYTGLRIGLATAKGICYTLDKALILYNKLDVLTLQLLYNTGGIAYDHYLTILPARDREYFITLYNNNGQPVIPARHIFETELLEIIERGEEKTMVSGVLNKTIVEMLTMKHIEFRENELIDQRIWSHMSFEAYKAGKFADLANSEPFYLKQVYTHTKL